MSLKRMMSRLGGRLGLSRRTRDLEEEVQFHLEKEIEQNMAAGMTREEARRQALISFGGVQQTREAVQRMHWLRSGDNIVQDLRYALRMAGKNPLLTAVLLGVLTIGIGANTAIFSVIDVVLLRMLPIKNPEQLVSLSERDDQKREIPDFNYPFFRSLLDQNEVLSGVLAADEGMTNFPITLTGPGTTGQSERVSVKLVSGTYFPVLGVDAVLGRALTPEDDQVAGAHPLAVISYGYWKRRFALDPSVLGKTFIAHEATFTIIGVAPPGFFGETPGESPDIWLPLTMKEQIKNDFGLNSASALWLNILARLKPDVTPERAEASLSALLQEVNGETMGPKAGSAEVHVEIRPASKGLDALRQRFSQPLRILMGVVGLVLLIACISVASLLTARAAARQREMAVRIALGASTHRLLQQLLTESILLASIGGMLGLLLTWWMSRALPAFLFDPETSLDLGLNGHVLAFTLVISTVTGIIFGLAPAFQVFRPGLAQSLKNDRAGTGALKPAFGLRRILVIAQIAFSIVLLVVAGLFVRTLQKLNNVDTGFNKENLLVVTLDPGPDLTPARLKTTFRDVLDKVRALPGVRSCSVSVGSFADGVITMGPMAVEGHTLEPGEDATLSMDIVSPGFFKTMGIPIVEGRDFRVQDDSSTPRVAIVNETFAKYYFGGASPLGKHLAWSRLTRDPMEIIGVAKDAKYDALREQTPRFFYTPPLQEGNLVQAVRLLEVRTQANPAAVASEVRSALNSVAPGLKARKISTMVIQIQDSLRQQVLLARLSGSFGSFALLLACLGLYGMMSHAVTRRTNEIGIRMALGAQRSQVVRMMLRETFLLIAAGIAVGIPAAFAITRLASSLISDLLFGVKAGEPQIILAGALIMGLVAMLAGYLPSRRAARIDPLAAIRCE